MKYVVIFLFKFLVLPTALFLFFYTFPTLQASTHLTIVISIVAAWMSWLIYAVIEHHKAQSHGLRNTHIAVLFSFLLVVSAGYYYYLTPSYLYAVNSPDGAYELKIYSKPKYFSAPGDGGTTCAVLKLYDNYGRKLRQTCDACPVFVYDIEVRWDEENQVVWYTKGGALELSPGVCN